MSYKIILLIIAVSVFAKEETGSFLNERIKLDKFINKFSGVWLDTNYISCLKNKKSPYLGVKKYPYYLSYIEKYYAKDTVVGIYDYQYRQTDVSFIRYYKLLDDSTLLFRYKKIPGSEKAYFDDAFLQDTISYFVCHDDTLMRLGRKDKHHYLKRIPTGKGDHFLSDITRLLVSSFLKGQYRVLDSSFRVIVDTITIDKDGFVNGWTEFKRMIIWSDYDGPANHFYDFDVLEMIPFGGDSSRYGFYTEDNDDFIFKFQLSNDTITIITTEYIGEYNHWDSKVKLGKPAFYFIKLD
ncbi:hypothetical protein QA601_18370 [Chitinispirillales bacterium ANBcel5]|uniref:hypothetical protein n=1 Tax=Cellulosispirillum alkaliphilum TaxID=3039283 RepID=UPI002A560AF1|nr:hypothetical protein [Chitinispirillales bacterium ANBcel5]